MPLTKPNENNLSGKSVAKAWARINGANGSTIASYNVSSTTRTGTGTYQANFITPMNDNLYSAHCTHIVGNGILSSSITSTATTSVAYTTWNSSGTSTDCNVSEVIVFGN